MRKGYRNNRQPQPYKAERISRVCDKTLYIVVPPRSEALRYQYSRTCRKAVTQRVKQERYRACRTDRRQCLVTEITSDYYRIDYIINCWNRFPASKGRVNISMCLSSLPCVIFLTYLFIYSTVNIVSFCSGKAHRYRDYNPFLRYCQ